MSAPMVFLIGDVVRLRKPHPCGSFEWTVVRLGADIGLRCNECKRKVLLPRRTLERRLKAFVARGTDPSAVVESTDQTLSNGTEATD
jgi:hypothetical protein